MEKRKLGNSGIEVSVVGLGCNNFGGRIQTSQRARAVVHRALDLGVTLFDTADVYGNGTSEAFLGEALGSAAQAGRDRHQVRHGASPERTPRGARSCAPSRRA